VTEISAHQCPLPQTYDHFQFSHRQKCTWFPLFTFDSVKDVGRLLPNGFPKSQSSSAALELAPRLLSTPVWDFLKSGESETLGNV
jgi:hypothetical protein